MKKNSNKDLLLSPRSMWPVWVSLDYGLCWAGWYRTGQAGIRGEERLVTRHTLCKKRTVTLFVMAVVVPRQRVSTKRTQSSIRGLAIGKPVVVVSKLENSVAFLHLQHQKFFLQRPKSKFGLSLLGTLIGIWNLDQFFQSMDFFLSLMACMLRCTMLHVLPSTRSTSFTSRRCRNTSVGDLARS